MKYLFTEDSIKYKDYKFGYTVNCVLNNSDNIENLPIDNIVLLVCCYCCTAMYSIVHSPTSPTSLQSGNLTMQCTALMHQPFQPEEYQVSR